MTMWITGKRVLVTGGTGSFGQFIVRRLLDHDVAEIRILSRALVVVGDQQGHAGFGTGKAKEVPMAIRKAIEQAKKSLLPLNLKGTTIPHQVDGHYGSGHVMLKPAPDGTGIIAGGAVRAVMEVAGIHNVLTKSLGSANPHNVVKATFDALLRLRSAQKVADMRSKTVEDLRR